jgi:hypothetical protein
MDEIKIKKIATAADQGKTILLPVTLQLYVDYRILSRPEMELRRIFKTTRGEAGSDVINVYGYKDDEPKRDSADD